MRRAGFEEFWKGKRGREILSLQWFCALNIPRTARVMDTYLHTISLGQACRVVDLCFEGSEKRRMLDLGLIKGTRVEAINRSPSGDPVAYAFRGAVIALRKEDAEKIIVDAE